MLLINTNGILVLVAIIFTSIILISVCTNLMFNILLFVNIILNLSFVYFYCGSNFIAFWIIIIYGEAITMFMLLSSSISKINNSENFTSESILKYYWHVIEIVVFILLLVYYSFMSIFSIKNYFIWNYILSTGDVVHNNIYINYNSVSYYSIDSLTNYLFTLEGDVILGVGVLLLEIMVCIIIILYTENV